MHSVRVGDGADLAGFRSAVRSLLAARRPPDEVVWDGSAGGLLDGGMLPAAPAVALPRVMGDLIANVVCHRDPERYALLYQLVWRFLHGERAILEIAADPLVHRVLRMDQAVHRAIHKMHAFVRFRLVEAPEGSERFAAWFEPEHFILEAAAPFFVERFPAMEWSIITPIGSLHWNKAMLMLGPPGVREDVPTVDSFEEGWRGYYESTFNPSRTNPRPMQSEMPKRYWRNMPEAAAIPDLIRKASSRVGEMMKREAVVSEKRVPELALAAALDAEPRSLDELNRIIAGSDPFVSGGTRAVLGEGPIGAAIAFVGEQPGDQEDLQGRPFVGPAGQIFDRAMAEAGLDRKVAYVTNAVKHFKFVQRGKRRLHQKPTAGEVKRYRWWLVRELELVRPTLTVALGATALLALSGRPLAVGANRGPMAFDGSAGFVTVHPSSLLRQPDEAARQDAYRAFVADLRQIRAMSRVA